MGVIEVKEKLLSLGIHAIQVEGGAGDDDAKGLTFIGSLDAYVSALKAIGVNHAFLTHDLLEENDFMHVPDISGMDDDDDGGTVVDLVVIRPALLKYKEYIGQQCRYKLSAPIANSTLDYLEQESWWKEFEELCGEAIESVDEEWEEEESRSQAEQGERDRKLIKNIQTLINDKAFTSLPTQRAMIEYAKENVPGVDTLDIVLLKDEIRTIDAKIKARRAKK